eukprot:scaffold320386_cov42-Prasinocladus_malaysianus.AAC.2
MEEYPPELLLSERAQRALAELARSSGVTADRLLAETIAFWASKGQHKRPVSPGPDSPVESAELVASSRWEALPDDVFSKVYDLLDGTR